MSAKPEALRLADELDKTLDFQNRAWSAAKELRRLHEVNQELLKALGDIEEHSHDLDAVDCAQAAIAKAKAREQ